MTNQEIFNIVWNGIISQGGLSIDGDSCKYRNSEGKKCAAGWLIPDDEYKKEFEGKIVYPNPELGPYLNEDLIIQKYFESKNIDLSFVRELQNIHDNSVGYGDNFLKYWKMKMEDFANIYNLTIPKTYNKSK